MVVIWALALLAATAAALTSASRTAALIAANGIDNAAAEALADAGVRLTMLNLGRFLAAPGTIAPLAVDGTARACRIADLGRVSLAIVSETGKVDLNTASDALLTRLLAGVGGRDLDAAGRTDKIGDFRDADDLRRLNGAEAEDYHRAGLTGGPKNAPFDAVEELGQVLGLAPDLAARLRPLVTVHSGASGIDPRLASPALLRALTAQFGPGSTDAPADPNALPPAFASLTAPSVFLIRAVAETPAGARYVREAIVEVTDAKRQKLEIRRWYRGEGEGGLAVARPQQVPAC